MKTTLITLLLLPFLSFGQVSEEDKNSIDSYTLSLCECMNDLMETMHPLMLDLIILSAEMGEEEAFMDMESKMAEMSEEEVEEFIQSAERMSSEEFEDQIDACDEAFELAEELDEKINSEAGAAFDYLLEVLDREGTCEIMNALYILGDAEEEE
ncbi:MAG: hypothetical protein Crog4KO_20810 [Crocinitomicaceae bacterium]